MTMIAVSLMISTVSFAQGLANFSGDYKLNYSSSACNPNARVEVSGTTVKIINQDLRDNRGWSTQTLTPGSKSWSMAAGINQSAKVSVVGTQVIVETTTKRGGSESAYVKDTYTFSEKNGRKSLMISLSVATRGNVDGWGVGCGYEKQ
jgi:hypothetical protein